MQSLSLKQKISLCQELLSHSVCTLDVPYKLWPQMNPEGETGGLDPISPPPEKSQVAIGFLKNTSIEPLKKQLLPK